MIRTSHADANRPARNLAEVSTWITGRRVRVGGPGGYTGTTAGLDQNGFLLVDGDDGTRHTVLSGGVRDLGQQ